MRVCGIDDIRVGGAGAGLIVWDSDGRAAAGTGRCGGRGSSYSGCCDGISRVRVLVGLLGDGRLVGLWMGVWVGGVGGVMLVLGGIAVVVGGGHRCS